MTLQNDFSKLDLDKILRRGDRDFTSGSKIPSELFQAAVFFSRPVSEELDQLNEEEKTELLKQENFFTRKKLKDFFEAFPNLCDLTFKNQRFIFPFYSQEIFVTQVDAVNYIPYFIKKLITEQRLPANVIKEDKSVDDDQIKTAVVPLQVVFLERDNPEFRS
jgi:hypothetical protein